MTSLFKKVEDGLKPAWNGLTVEERSIVIERAREFGRYLDIQKRIADGTIGEDYDPGASPYTMNVELLMEDYILFHFNKAIQKGMALKKFRSLDPGQQMLENMFH